ncbi:nmd protein affecting ribosome stability and mRNA decay [Halogeometricum pallidum JCM 14848]|uniref:Nmd protein affecting ribosome stability and mRNA decay n=1 Tax=Halogeometricum pallidum JCM 14848 TaxID=1227487 RepID=M0D894_HALPD|nr:60S ribosomal export protein NMD3 [Halogeometricum pallidum]ELZ30912.1 nmd protein affecting ribosome stability and mRNA decay [Halogeometricum pallidum JCM 14848]
MSSGDFCPRCGDPVPEREEPLPGMPRDKDAVLCDSCYFEDFDLVDAPERIEVRVCSQCGAVHKGNRWVDVGAQDYTDVAVEEVSEALGVHLSAEDVRWGVEPEQVDENNIRMHCTFSGIVRGTRVEETVTVPVLISRQTCKRCGRIAGGYYASIVQIRGEDRDPTNEEERRAIEIAESYIAERQETGDRNAFISEITESGEGPDIKISTNQMGGGIAKHVVRELGGSFEEYPTLVTEDGDGNEVYRVTYAVRLPKFTPGEVIDTDDDGGPVLVRSVRGNLKGVRIDTGGEYEARFEEGETPEARRLGTVDDAAETTVVTVEDENAVQVLDPETYESKTISRPSYFDSDADSVPVLKSRAGLHILPNDAVESDAEE